MEKTYTGVLSKSNITTEEKTFTPTSNVQTYTPTSDTYISKVTVNAIPSSYIIPSGTKTITDNGTHDVSAYANVEVNVASSGVGGGVAPGDDEYIDFVIKGSNSQRFAFDGLLVCSNSPVVTNSNGEVSVDGDYSGGITYPENSDCWGIPAVPFPDDGYYGIIIPAKANKVELARWKVPKKRIIDFEIMGDTMGLPGMYECQNATVIEYPTQVSWGYRYVIIWDFAMNISEIVFHIYDTGFNPS